ncbi:hypothetical protein F5B22DRAFT_589431 [Xylaria bambusicola]|uniref:uncharacterized protein n=1 Tax=Xylaria bambusicola TaxID=326684 RepID=UPI002008DE6C|nr:uncharacterized protein F5B22DRAFT_589431 [Xylaria bambusicola]KAI0525319.1 hypothetical protein F5B22DRAFT_589431 [Xylaria bambusicola]
MKWMRVVVTMLPFIGDGWWGGKHVAYIPGTYLSQILSASDSIAKLTSLGRAYCLLIGKEVRKCGVLRGDETMNTHAHHVAMVILVRRGKGHDKILKFRVTARWCTRVYDSVTTQACRLILSEHSQASRVQLIPSNVVSFLTFLTK